MSLSLNSQIICYSGHGSPPPWSVTLVRHPGPWFTVPAHHPGALVRWSPVPGPRLCWSGPGPVPGLLVRSWSLVCWSAGPVPGPVPGAVPGPRPWCAGPLVSGPWSAALVCWSAGPVSGPRPWSAGPLVRSLVRGCAGPVLVRSLVRGPGPRPWSAGPVLVRSLVRGCAGPAPIDRPPAAVIGLAVRCCSLSWRIFLRNVEMSFPASRPSMK